MVVDNYCPGCGYDEQSRSLSSLRPACPMCGEEMTTNWDDAYNYVSDENYEEEEA